ncbi:integrase, catalytic region, zinc finger, CCHC-type containing protein [Tanacetum coccineum]
MKAEALKTQATASRPIKALTVYPQNTPATLVPRVLPTKSQVKINIFALIQLFLDFEKTCNKRITPTGLTEGERGFEQTKACYLTEVIPFFKTLKEHFEGIQKALTKEIKEMKDIFEELEAEVDQNGVDRKHDEIERKNLLIANDNLIADCLSKEVFYVATNSELNVSSFTEMHDAHTSLKARCLELELKYQNLKESFGNNPPSPARDTPDFESVFVIGKMKASLQGKDNVIKKLKMQISHLQETSSEVDRTLDFRALNYQITQLTSKITRTKHIEQTTALTTENENLKAQIHNKVKNVTKDHVKPKVLAPGKYAIDVEPIPPRNRNNREVHLDYLRHLKESVETLREIVEEAKVERPLDRSIVSACRYTKHSQELLEYAIGTCPKDYNQRDKKHDPTPLIRKKQVTFEEQCDTSHSNTHKHVEQLNTQKTNAPVPPSTGVNCCTDASGSQPRSNTKKNRISPAKGVNKMKVEEHPRTNKSHLRTTNRVDSSSSSKRTIQEMTFCAIDGYGNTGLEDKSGDFQGILCGRTGTQSLFCSCGSNLYTISVEDMMKFSPICLLSKASKNKSWLWHRRLNHLNFDTINDLARKDLVRGLPRLKFEKDHLLVHDKKLDLTFFKVFGALCYPTNDSEDLGKLQPTVDIGIFVGYAPSRKGYRIYNKRTRRIMKTIHVQFDELTEQMAPVQISTGPAPTFLTPG